jgi:hypothetical protein
MEIEVRTYSYIGNLLHTEYFNSSLTLKKLEELFPDSNFEDPENNNIWIETKEQAEHFGKDFSDIQSGIGYEIFPLIY